MGWSEVIDDIEEKVTGAIEGTFRPLDGIPFFTICYPPEEERNAIREFKHLSERFVVKDIPSEVISMKEVLKDALIELGVANEDDEGSILEFERNNNMNELKNDLSRYLPEQVSEVLLRKLRDKDRNFVAVLIRTGALYPFVRTSSIRAKLEKNPYRDIVSVVKVTDHTPEIVGTELEEYVPTEEVKENFREIIEGFIETKRGYTEEVCVWLSKLCRQFSNNGNQFQQTPPEFFIFTLDMNQL